MIQQPHETRASNSDQRILTRRALLIGASAALLSLTACENDQAPNSSPLPTSVEVRRQEPHTYAQSLMNAINRGQEVYGVPMINGRIAMQHSSTANRPVIIANPLLLSDPSTSFDVKGNLNANAWFALQDHDNQPGQIILSATRYNPDTDDFYRSTDTEPMQVVDLYRTSFDNNNDSSTMEGYYLVAFDRTGQRSVNGAQQNPPILSPGIVVIESQD